MLDCQLLTSSSSITRAASSSQSFANATFSSFIDTNASHTSLYVILCAKPFVSFNTPVRLTMPRRSSTFKGVVLEIGRKVLIMMGLPLRFALTGGWNNNHGEMLQAALSPSEGNDGRRNSFPLPSPHRCRNQGIYAQRACKTF